MVELLIEDIAELEYNLAISGDSIMPIIKSSADIRNNYSKVSKLCHETNEPVFITKNGKGDLAVMSIETYDSLFGRLNIYKAIEDGLKDVKNGNVYDSDEVMNYLSKIVNK